MVRLFNIDSYQLVEFGKPGTGPPPKYAVFSHVWVGPEEEVTHAEWHRLMHYKNCEVQNTALDEARAKDYSKLRSKKGFVRIAGFIQALRGQELGGIEWAWEYTRCVNSANTAEVDDAILQSWGWLKGSAICLAFLDDMPPPQQPLLARPSELICARWWKRAWTLPELLAPPQVLFYGNRWNVLAYRRDMSEIIFFIAQIEARYLTSRLGVPREDAHRAPQALRLAWAARRQCLRPEDRVYSMIGIMDVRMQPRYGEGLENACRRLFDALVRQRPDGTLTTWGFRHNGPWVSGRLFPDNMDSYVGCRTVIPFRSKPAFVVDIKPDPAERGYFITTHVIQPPTGDPAIPLADYVYIVLDAKVTEKNRRLVLPLIPVRRDDPNNNEYWRAPSCNPVAFHANVLTLTDTCRIGRRTIFVRNEPAPPAHLLSLRFTGLESKEYHGVLQETWPPTVHGRHGTVYLPLDDRNVPDRRSQWLLLRIWTAAAETIVMVRYRAHWADDHSWEQYEDRALVPPPPLPNRPRQLRPVHVQTRVAAFSAFYGYQTCASLAEFFARNPPTADLLGDLFDDLPDPDPFYFTHTVSVERRPPTPEAEREHQARLLRGEDGATLAPYTLCVKYSVGATRPMDEIFLHHPE